MSAPRISIVVPAHNAAATIGACLEPLLRSAGAEVVVVNDRSTDDTAAIARSLGATVIDNPRGRGPGAARNAGAAHARADVLLFVDADVVVTDTSVDQVLGTFDRAADVDALFGSYDDEPHATNFLSQYKNLLHHFVHQTAATRSCSFWGGFGAIRRRAFDAVGGFDEHRYRRASIEDIELGFRLNRAGFHVVLDPNLQVKHLKEWRPLAMFRTEILDRAYPWSALILSGGDIPDDLNLRWSARFSAASVGLLALAIPFLLFGHRSFYGVPVFPVALVVALLALLQALVLNRGFYLFLLRARGVLFMVRAIPLHFCYYLYSAATFVVCWAIERLRRRAPASRGTNAAAAP